MSFFLTCAFKSFICRFFSLSLSFVLDFEETIGSVMREFEDVEFVDRVLFVDRVFA